MKSWNLQTIDRGDGAGGGCQELVVVALVALRIHLRPAAEKTCRFSGGEKLSGCTPAGLGLKPAWIQDCFLVDGFNHSEKY